MRKRLLLTSLLAFVFLTGCAYDDGELRNGLNSLEERIKNIEQTLAAMNTDITSIRSVIEAMNGEKRITDVKEVGDGHQITFSDGSSIVLKHGKDGSNGAAGDTPVIGVEKDGDGKYYWNITVNGETELMKDADGNPIPVYGEDGSGGKGEDGYTPVMGVDADGYWTVTINGTTDRIKDINGNEIKATATDGKDGDSFFKSVEVADGYVTIVLMSGESFVLPVSNFSIGVAAFSTEYFKYGETRTFTLTATGADNVSISKPDGWKVVLNGTALSVTAPLEANVYSEFEGEIALTAVSNKYADIVKFRVFSSAYTVVSFETDEPSFLAGPTAYGENLYSSFQDDQNYGYTGTEIPIMLIVNEYYGNHDMWNGATFLSQWNDTQTEGIINQCSVYSKDAATGLGGHNGSETFAIATGIANAYGGQTPYLLFYDGADYTLDHIYITNTTYVTFSMMNGDTYAKKFTYDDQDWFRLTIKGIGADEQATGTVEFYLADFRTPSSPGIVTEWTKVDLTALGAVNKLEFYFASSDNGDYGMNTPAYCCFDDIAIAD